jgi:nicotinamidase-related amidase
MQSHPAGRERILRADDCLLLIIDAQAHFFRKLDAHTATAVMQRIAWVAALAAWLRVPVIATAEELERHGGSVPAIARETPADAPLFDKPAFGLAGNPTILAAVLQEQRQTAVLVGLETDVCVLQSALGLLDAGLRVVVVQDATASPGPGHQAGLDRMRALGVELVTVKGLFYEWVRTVAAADQFLTDRADIGAPYGIVL